MPPKFGTSGLRGLVVDLTQELVSDYTRAFLAACPVGGAVYLGRDLRASSPDIAAAVAGAVRGEGVDVVDCGVLPTPALALAAGQAKAGAIMVTGSHIPADRNGLKFYTPSGEISKEDEGAINANLGRAPAGGQGALSDGAEAAVSAYSGRYRDAFGADALTGLRIGVYQHSSVARDIMMEVIAALGATPVALGRSDTFIPVDTEALDPDTQTLLGGWCAEHGLDAVISTDGDADRPMLANAQGQVIPGDVLGALSAQSLGARLICTPVSSNSMIAQMSEFDEITLTRIGSPFVIAAMEAVLGKDRDASVVGYEANGGFLLGFTASGPAGPLAPLMTRDCLLPILAPLAMARAAGQSLSELVASLPPRFTAADRLQGIATENSKAFLAELQQDAEARAAFFAETGSESGVDLTDGLRVTFDGGDVVHLRPSGNAPEFRCYAEAASFERAQSLVQRHLGKIADKLG
ncbi:Phosphoglucosamine mutase [Pelagimonas phthalicica]|uniref:Phosphoglucosamine mutase n=1 Tax=Pelagimonas phthalicica TaxID=1037362 RepID=A0A238J8U8_9RHOB|nr:phosphomannomutase [Pelagimonas phthalicica]TDS94657.1 phosphomannomutase [Pelagimonas phthalicica]SMX26815.1 Phosphoglucosamine mutase [Pelagimonas phthalicica]